MRTMFGVFAAAVVLAGLTGQALASNDLYITGNDRENNLADLTATGSGNVLSVVQTYDGLGDGNALTVSLDGNLNGGPLGAAFGGGNVGHGRAQPGARHGLPDPLDRLRHRGGLAAVHDHLGAGGRQPLGDGEADPGGGAGDEGSLAGQVDLHR